MLAHLLPTSQRCFVYYLSPILKCKLRTTQKLKQKARISSNFSSRIWFQRENHGLLSTGNALIGILVIRNYSVTMENQIFSCCFLRLRVKRESSLALVQPICVSFVFLADFVTFPEIISLNAYISQPVWPTGTFFSQLSVQKSEVFFGRKKTSKFFPNMVLSAEEVWNCVLLRVNLVFWDLKVLLQGPVEPRVRSKCCSRSGVVLFCVKIFRPRKKWLKSPISIVFSYQICDIFWKFSLNAFISEPIWTPGTK